MSLRGKANKENPGINLVSAIQNAKAVPALDNQAGTACFFDTMAALPPETYEKVDYLRKNAESILTKTRTLNQDMAIAQLPSDEIRKMLSDAIKISSSLRNAWVYQQQEIRYPRKAFPGPNPVRVRAINNGFMQLSLPALSANRTGNGYDLYWFTKDAIIDFEEKNGYIQSGRESITIIYKRYLKNKGTPSFLDNDNYEAKRVTNAICECIGHDDNCFATDFLYTSVASQYTGIEATVIPQSALNQFIQYLRCPIPDDADFLMGFV